MDRRVFFNTIAAGGGAAALAGGGVWMLGASPALAQGVATRGISSAVFDEAARQLQAAANAIRSEADGEALRMAAAANRLLVAWSRDNQFDVRVRATVRSAIRQHGRSALLVPHFDVQEELKARGLPVPAGTVLVPPTTETMAAALSRLETQGVTRSFEGLAAMFAHGATQADKRAGGVRRIDHDSDHEQWCRQIRMTIDLVEAMVVIFCNPLMLWGLEICVVVSAELIILLALKWAEGCG